MQDFIDWLIKEMEKRGWNNSELARQARISQATVSMIVSGNRQPGVEFCLGIARAFREPPERVFRRAGLLPDVEGIEEKLYKELRAYIEELSPARREELIHYVKFLHQLEREREEADARDGEDNTP